MAMGRASSKLVVWIRCQGYSGLGLEYTICYKSVFFHNLLYTNFTWMDTKIRNISMDIFFMDNFV